MDGNNGKQACRKLFDDHDAVCDGTTVTTDDDLAFRIDLL